ncbi:MAG: adenylosuccinate lyase [Arcanobacterium sp.]
MKNLAEQSDFIALTPLDGRYRSDIAPLVDYLSEAALNRARIHVEVEWLIFVSTNKVIAGAPVMNEDDVAYVRSIVDEFDGNAVAEMKEIEAETRHDVKAVEYFLKRRLADAPNHLPNTVLPQLAEAIHIFATSEDVNNLAYAVTVRDATKKVWLPTAQSFVDQLTELARAQANQPMLSRTHGQTATPTTLGKEIAVLAWRLTRQLRRIEKTEYLGKFNGATGTYGAHSVAVPEADWPQLSRDFVTGLGLTWNPLTTQIESHDWMAELFSDIARFNAIAHNLATDFWTYISLGYFHQNLAAQGSTGSSTMPHKVNPIRFENAESNIETSNALFNSLGATLVTSRLQRDLTDSSTLRNTGVAFGHSLLALNNLKRGVAGLDVAAHVLEADLDNAWEVLGEPVQQAMRAAQLAGVEGMANPYERLKELTRGKTVDAAAMREFIASLGIPAEIEERLLALTPASYTGLAADLVAYLQA